jgi:adenine-specific DNA glycosylase
VKKHVNLYLLLIQKYENEKFVLMKKNPSNGIWANLWNLPSFNGVNEYKKFLLSNNLSGTSSQYDYIEHNLSHLKLKINIIKVELKKCTEVDNYCWKNIYDKIGSSKPIIMIIDKLKKEQK